MLKTEVVEAEVEVLEEVTLTLKRWAVLRPETVVYTFYILMFVKRKFGRDSVVGIAIRYGLDAPGIGFDSCTGRWSKVYVFGRSVDGIMSWKPDEGIDVLLLCLLCVL
jgi:hypothetical protein